MSSLWLIVFMSAARNHTDSVFPLIQDFQSKDLPNTRIQPDRRWFGNTRVVGQKQLEQFREQMSSKVNILKSDSLSCIACRSKTFLMQDHLDWCSASVFKINHSSHHRFCSVKQDTDVLATTEAAGSLFLSRTSFIDGRQMSDICRSMTHTLFCFGKRSCPCPCWKILTPRERISRAKL